jgi:hypothetical protein
MRHHRRRTLGTAGIADQRATPAARSEPKTPAEQRNRMERRRPASELEAEARAINATDWAPLPGMVKRRCSQCRYWFAVPVDEAEMTSRCPDCTSLGRVGWHPPGLRPIFQANPVRRNGDD